MQIKNISKMLGILQESPSSVRVYDDQIDYSKPFDILEWYMENITQDFGYVSLNDETIRLVPQNGKVDRIDDLKNYLTCVDFLVRNNKVSFLTVSFVVKTEISIDEIKCIYMKDYWKVKFPKHIYGCTYDILNIYVYTGNERENELFNIDFDTLKYLDRTNCYMGKVCSEELMRITRSTLPLTGDIMYTIIKSKDYYIALDIKNINEDWKRYIIKVPQGTVENNLWVNLPLFVLSVYLKHITHEMPIGENDRLQIVNII